MRLGALESLQRGVLNLRANRPLILLIWLQRFLLVLLSVVAFVPFYLVLEFESPGARSTPEEYMDWFVRFVEQLLAQTSTVPFWMAVLASSAILLVVMFVYSFFQAGAFGILTEGERRGTFAGSAEAFRAYSWQEFQALGGRFLWRFFWLFNVVLLFWMVWTLLAMLAAVAAGVAAGSGGLAVGVALGCLAILPILLGVVVLTVWGWLAQAELVASDCGVWAALLGGLRVLVRRLGLMTVLFILLTIVVAGVAIVFLLLGVTLETGLAAFDAARTVLWWLLQAVQWLIAGIIHLVFSATLICVTHAEHGEPGSAGVTI